MGDANSRGPGQFLETRAPQQSAESSSIGLLRADTRATGCFTALSSAGRSLKDRTVCQQTSSCAEWQWFGNCHVVVIATIVEEGRMTQLRNVLMVRRRAASTPPFPGMLQCSSAVCADLCRSQGLCDATQALAPHVGEVRERSIGDTSIAFRCSPRVTHTGTPKEPLCAARVKLSLKTLNAGFAARSAPWNRARLLLRRALLSRGTALP